MSTQYALALLARDRQLIESYREQLRQVDSIEDAKQIMVRLAAAMLANHSTKAVN